MNTQSPTHGKIVSTPIKVTVPSGFGVESGRKFYIHDLSLTPPEICDIGREARNKAQCLSMVAAVFTDHALRETICLLKKQGLYKFNFKQAGNEMQRLLKAWFGEMSVLLGERYEALENMAIDRMGVIFPLFNKMQVKATSYFQKKHIEKSDIASRLLITDHIIGMSHWTASSCYRSHDVDFFDMFKHYDLSERCGDWRNRFYRGVLTSKELSEALNDSDYNEAANRFYERMADYDELLPIMKDLVCGEHSDMFSNEERNDITEDCLTTKG